MIRVICIHGHGWHWNVQRLFVYILSYTLTDCSYMIKFISYQSSFRLILFRVLSSLTCFLTVFFSGEKLLSLQSRICSALCTLLRRYRHSNAIEHLEWRPLFELLHKHHRRDATLPPSAGTDVLCSHRCMPALNTSIPTLRLEVQIDASLPYSACASLPARERAR